MAGLTAAWALSDPAVAGEVESVTVYQRGWRLGGKGASSRGARWRIEEHGLHVWLGYYDNAFRLLRQVYGELDRPVTAPGCPIASWRDAFTPAGRVGVAEEAGGRWSSWVATFSGDADEPGGAPAGAGPPTVAQFVRRSVQLLLDLSSSLGHGRPPAAPGVFLSGSARPPGAGATAGDPSRSLSGFGDLARQAEAAALVAAVTTAEVLGSSARPVEPLSSLVVEHLDRLREDWAERVRRDPAARRLWQVAGLVLACARGAASDGLLAGPDGFAAIDHLDFRDWLAGHGASPETLGSPLVRGMYDLVFAYEGGDPERPRFAAGLGLFLASKLFFEYRGSIFWKMRAGMGEVVFAPLYQALRARGVRFEFFSRVDQLHLSDDRRSVAAVTVARQARLADGVGAYDPLVTVGGLPCFPARPQAEQLATVRHLIRRWVTAQGGTDDDCAAFAISVTEACANSVEHAYGLDDSTVYLRAEVNDREAVVTVRDRGGWREPRGANRGRGIPVMKEFMDDVVIDTGERGTTVELRRRIGGGNGP